MRPKWNMYRKKKNILRFVKKQCTKFFIQIYFDKNGIQKQANLAWSV